MSNFCTDSPNGFHSFQGKDRVCSFCACSAEFLRAGRQRSGNKALHECRRIIQDEAYARQVRAK